MQNTQLCSTIVQLSFTPEELNLIFTFPLIYSIFQIIAAALFLAGEEHSHSRSTGMASLRNPAVARTAVFNSLFLAVK